MCFGYWQYPHFSPRATPAFRRRVGALPASRRGRGSGRTGGGVLGSAAGVTGRRGDKGDHQKADNAAVPDHLWLRAFVLGYRDKMHPTRHLEALSLPLTSRLGFLGDARPPDGWRGALSSFRLFALQHWRSRVTRDYIYWRRANVPIGACDRPQGPLVQYRWERRAGGGSPLPTRGRRGCTVTLDGAYTRRIGRQCERRQKAEPRSRLGMMPYTVVRTRRGSSGAKGRPSSFGIGGRNINEM